MLWFKSSQLIIDVVTTDPCNATNESSSVNVVNKKEVRKISKYSDLSSKLNDSQFKKYVFTPFGISVYGRVGDSGLEFLEDFRCFVKERRNKHVYLSYGTNRIVFSCFKSLPEMISRLLKFMGSYYESLFGSIDGVDFGCLVSCFFIVWFVFNSPSSALFTQLPQIYGLLLNNEELETVTPLRCSLNVKMG
ncbi:hypothetical protein RCL1_005957 [Eukaryota sp. TZLM3-RCL]